MCKRWLLCVLLGSLAWAQAPAGAPTPAGPTPTGARPQAMAAPDTSASVPATAAVITVTLKSSCPGQPKAATVKPAAATGTAMKAARTAKTPGECKTVYTKEEFERLASAASPNMTPQLKRQLSNVLPRFTAMSEEAEKKGLDKTPRFKETMKFLRMQALSQELQRQVQEDAGKVTDKEIADYYAKNPEAYQQFSLDRLFIPRFKQGGKDEAEEGKEDDKDDNKDEKLTEDQKKAKQEKEKADQAKGEEAMTKLAETLQARAAAGEDFMALQKEAFAAAGMKIESPTINLPKVRRTGLPQGHVAVFDLKAGEVSQAINDAGGHYVYKVATKDQLSLDVVKDEITGVLKNQQIRDAMDGLTNSFTVETNEAYFGPPPPAGLRPNMPVPHMPSPRPSAQPSAPQAPAQTQPSTAKPN
jgi:hypothetical protein